MNTSARGGFLSALAGYAVVLKNSGALASASLVTAVLGFSFWWIAAHVFAPETVGKSSALISLIGLVSLLAEVGLGTLLITEVPRHPGREQGLIAAALLASSAFATILSALYLVASYWLSANNPHVGFTPAAGMIFLFGCILTTISQVFDAACIGLLKSSLVLQRAAISSLMKVLVLCMAAEGLTIIDIDAAISFSWVVGLLISMVYTFYALNRSLPITLVSLNLSFAVAKIPRTIDHYFLNIALNLPGLLLPLIVTFLLSPETNAAFYASWMILNTSFILPIALSTIINTLGSATPSAIKEQIDFSLKVSLLYSIFAFLIIFTGADLVLRLFNPLYAPIAASSLQILAASVIAVSVKVHFLAIIRANDRMRQVLLPIVLCSLIECIAAAVGSQIAELRGLALGWTLVIFAEAIVMLPTVLRARS